MGEMKIPKCQHCEWCRTSKVGIDRLYQQMIVYNLDRDFVLEMQHISRIAMLPPDWTY